jgi:Kef-type K+ transport system membrane component KefB
MALIIYVVVSSYAKMSLRGAEVHVGAALLSAAASLGVSVLLGFLFGMVYVLVLRKFRDKGGIELLLAAWLLLLLGLSEYFHVSELLSIMVFGAVVTNGHAALSRRSSEIIDHLAPVFLAAFFVLGGAHLDITLIKAVGLIGLAYFVARSAGKIGGATLGAVIGKAPKGVRGRIGFALMPQVGVALALALSISREFTSQAYGAIGADIASYVINILLLTTILTEIVGPLATRRVLKSAGEINAGNE